MAISIVGSSSIAAGTTSITLALPTCLEGDVVLVAIGAGYPGNIDLGVTTTGYTEVADLWVNNDNTLDANLSVSWKRMGSTPDTEVVCENASGSASYGTTVIAYVLRGVNTTVLDVAVTTATGIDSAIPAPAAITPVTAETLVVVCGCGTNEDATITPPIGYTNGVSEVFGGTADHTTAIASKQWSGSGAETPAAWTGWATGSTASWVAATLAIKPATVISPPTGGISITGTTPAIAIAPASGELAITADTPVPGIAVPVSPSSGELTIAGGTPVPLAIAAVFPPTVQMRIIGQVPVPLGGSSLVVSLPPLTSLFEAKGLNASLQVTLPAIAFVGETSAPGWLAVTLPPVNVLLGGGNSLVIDLPMPEVLLTGAVGSIGSLHVDLPSLAFSAGAGSALALDLPPLESLFTGTVGTAGALHVSLPPFAALFAGTVETKGELVINLPGLQSLFTATQQNLGSLHVDLPPLAALFSGAAGETASLQVTLPALEALFTAYEDLTGQMVIVLPALQALFEAAQSGRFDTATPTQLDGVILRYRRPV